MKVEIAQIKTDPGRFEENTQKIIDAIKKAKSDRADLIVFPEMTIPGYMSMDLMLKREYLQRNKESLTKIVPATENIAAIIGFVDFNPDIKKVGPDGTPLRHNSAAVIFNKKIIGIEDKTLLPDYDVFYENRYFQKGRRKNIYEINGVKVGVEVCEDLWDENYSIKVSDRLVQLGAEVLINISASPFYSGKKFVRENLIKNVVKKHKVPFVYANLVGGQDGYEGELIFDGQSMVFSDEGKLIGLGRAFEEDIFLVDLKRKNDIRFILYNPVAELQDALVLGIKDYFRRTNFQKAFIGLSGGIDSAVTACLAVEALGRENVVGVGMPSRYSSLSSVEDARKLAENLGIEFKLVSIEAIRSKFETGLEKEFDGFVKDVTEENIQARVRGIILMAFANKCNGLVISTGNKTETALGYTTLYGDMCGGLAVISDVSKLKVYELADLINIRAGKYLIPESTVKKAPSAELKENQTDEQSLGPYEIISPLVDDIVEEELTKNELITKYPKELVDRTLGLMTAAEFKRRQAPPGIKVTKKAFGVGRRIPISHGF